MNWCFADNFTNANHNPIVVLNGDRTKNVLTISATNGATVALNTEGTSDPDENSVLVTWWIYPEAGNISDATLTKTAGLTTKVRLTQIKNLENFTASCKSRTTARRICLRIDARSSK